MFSLFTLWMPSSETNGPTGSDLKSFRRPWTEWAASQNLNPVVRFRRGSQVPEGCSVRGALTWRAYDLVDSSLTLQVGHTYHLLSQLGNG